MKTGTPVSSHTHECESEYPYIPTRVYVNVALLLPWGTCTPILVLLCHFFNPEARMGQIYGQSDRRTNKHNSAY